MNLKPLAVLTALLLGWQLPAQQPPKSETGRATAFKVVTGRVINIDGHEATMVLADKGRVTVKLLDSALTVKDGDAKQALQTVSSNMQLYFRVVESSEFGIVVQAAGHRPADVSPIVTPPPPPGSTNPKEKSKK